MTQASVHTASPEIRLSSRGFWAKLQAAFHVSETVTAIIAENNHLRASGRHWLM